MVALLDFSVRVVKRLDEIIERRAGTDRRQVRADFAACAADGVATHAGELELAVNQLTAGGIAALLDRLLQRISVEWFHRLGRELLLRLASLARVPG